MTVQQMKEVQEERKFMNTEQLAEYTTLSGRTLRKLCLRAENPLPHIRVGNRIFYLRDSVDEWLLKQEVK